MTESCDYIIDICPDHDDAAREEGCPYCEIKRLTKQLADVASYEGAVQRKRIEQFETEAAKIVQLLRDVGIATNWVDREQTDRIFAWYEFDGLRMVLGEADDHH